MYDKESFIRNLYDLSDFNNKISPIFILEKLRDSFTFDELKVVIEETKIKHKLTLNKEFIINQMMWLARSHYEIFFSFDSAISERVIFPISTNEKNGIEDARFVKFTDDKGQITYYSTYTAYDGTSIMPKLLKTIDFYHHSARPLHGEIAQNKDMALFPLKVNGKYVMLCRMDGFNDYIAFSDNINIWRDAKLLQKLKFPRELIQIENCGSSIETSEGWFVITHGVGQCVNIQ
jgi:beta-1,2-mannobiose phosphorylase / 1,2-beta-oligomannan phosphorylase